MELIFNYNLRETGKPYKIKVHFQKNQSDEISIIGVYRKGEKVDRFIDRDYIEGLIRDRIEIL